jgi:hypothetical protein
MKIAVLKILRIRFPAGSRAISRIISCLHPMRRHLNARRIRRIPTVVRFTYGSGYFFVIESRRGMIVLHTEASASRGLRLLIAFIAKRDLSIAWRSRGSARQQIQQLLAG